MLSNQLFLGKGPRAKDVATSTRDDASSPENIDLEEHTSIMTTPPAAALSRPAPSFNDIQTQTRPPKERPPPWGCQEATQIR